MENKKMYELEPNSICMLKACDICGGSRQNASLHNKIDTLDIDDDIQAYKDNEKKYQHTAIVRLGDKYSVVKAKNLTYADFSGYLNHKYSRHSWIYASLDGGYVAHDNDDIFQKAAHNYDNMPF